ncbi:MAG: hypothetical protein LBE06_07430 [Azoarcus sp.]|jgi:hypothetical protein|nr:hypothetical protein [Azoarcus sp.]
MSFFDNPEFRRNCWLKLSPIRLALMPVVILLVIMAIKAGDGGGQTIRMLACLGFLAMTALGGAKEASGALREEFSCGTWDSQRMSSLTPWQMVWGKLFGSTLYVWYGGVILLGVAAFAAHGEGARIENIALTGVIFVEVALFLQCSAMLSTLCAWRMNRQTKQTMIGILVVFLFVFLMWGMICGIVVYDSDKFETIAWRHQVWDLQDLRDLFALFLFLLIAWVFIALWQVMRAEFLLRNHLGWWLAFYTFWLLWGAGFVEKNWFVFFLSAVLVVWVSIYLFLFSGRKDQMAWLRLLTAFRRRDIRLLQHLAPGWLISFAVLVVLCVCALFAAGKQEGALFVFFASGLSFVVRDIVFILWINLVAARRPDVTAVLYLLVAYCVLPSFFGNLFLPPFLSRDYMKLLFSTDFSFTMPTFSISPLFAALLQAGLAGYLLHRRLSLNPPR